MNAFFPFQMDLPVVFWKGPTSTMQFPCQSIKVVSWFDSKSIVGWWVVLGGREAMQIFELHPQLRKLHLLGAPKKRERKQQSHEGKNTRFEGIKRWRKFREELIPMGQWKLVTTHSSHIFSAFLCVHWLEIWLESWVYFGSFPGCWRFRFWGRVGWGSCTNARWQPNNFECEIVSTAPSTCSLKERFILGGFGWHRFRVIMVVQYDCPSFVSRKFSFAEFLEVHPLNYCFPMNISGGRCALVGVIISCSTLSIEAGYKTRWSFSNSVFVIFQNVMWSCCKWHVNTRDIFGATPKKWVLSRYVGLLTPL